MGENMERTFENVGRMDSFTLRNQNGALFTFNDADIDFLLEDMFEDVDQFVTLTSPVAVNKIRYVQACMCDEGVEVQLGIEEKRTRLVHKICTRNECLEIFQTFFEGEFAPKLEEYSPVEF